MTFDFNEFTLNECLDKVIDNRGKTPPITDSITPYPLIEINAIVGHAKTPNFSVIKKYVTEETYCSWFRAGHPQPDDVIFSTVGSIAEVAIFKGGSGCIAQNLVGLRPNIKLITPDFLYYSLVSPSMQSLLRTLDISSVQPSIKVPHLLATKLKLPPLKEQKIVGNILSVLDDRITLLRETNSTLEAIAQALFKSWFVDFDPVRAKQEGRQPEGLDEATAALFPDSFEQSELGEIPKGWAMSNVGDSFVLTMGQSPPGNTYCEDENEIPFYQGRTDFGFRFPTKRMYCTSPIRIAEIGDTLVSVRAPVGDVNMAIEKCCIGRGVASVCHPENYRSFTFYAIAGLKSHFKNFDSEGTIFGSINKNDFQDLQIISPSTDVLAAYDETSRPIDSRIVENELQVRVLSNLRDTLLPRLISGQLRLPAAEEQIEAATA